MARRKRQLTTIALNLDTKLLLMDLRWDLFKLTGKDWTYDQILNQMLKLFAQDFLTEIGKRQKK